MAYAILRQGNNNTSENKKLQQALKDAGYGKYLGSAGVDGIYGSGTAAAVKAYQKANGLAVDGIAGNETLGHLYGSKSSSTAKKTVAEPTPAKTYRYDDDNDANYQQALKNAESVNAEKPEYAGTYDEQVKALFDKIMNREPFEYDLNGDALWKQYSDQYTQKGKLAMMDAMGQAAALTGGYGNSYGQGVGQQTYQGYLQNLNDRIPELYQLALQKYNAEAALQQEQFGAARELQTDEYGKYQDAMGQYNIDVDRAQSAADTAWDRGYNSWYTETQLRNQDEETAYNRQQTAYANLANLIAGAGYSPTAEELEAAGMTRGQAAALGMQYDREHAAAAQRVSSPIQDDGDDPVKYADYDEKEWRKKFEDALTKNKFSELELVADEMESANVDPTKVGPLLDEYVKALYEKLAGTIAASPHQTGSLGRYTY